MNEEPTLLDIARGAAKAGNAGHWPTVAAILIDEIERLERQVHDAKVAFHADGSDRAAATKMLEILSANDPDQASR